MKQAKRIASLLLAVAMVFTLVFAHGNIFGVFAEGDVKVLLDQNFDEEAIGTDGGWKNNTATPEPTPAEGFEQWLKHSVSAGPNGSSNAFHIIGSPFDDASITHTLYQKELDEPATSITLTYDVYLHAHTTKFEAILPVPLYTGAADKAYDVDAAPVQLQASWLEGGQSPLTFSLGKGVYEPANVKIPCYGWYTFQIEVDTSKETYQEGVKISYGPKGGELTELELPTPTKANNVPVWKQGATMDRISTGFSSSGKTEMYLDNIKVTTAAEKPLEIGEESVLSENFESYNAGDAADWTNNPATPEPTPNEGYADRYLHAVSVTPDNSSKAFEIKGQTTDGTGITHTLYQKSLSQEVKNIKLTYDVYLRKMSGSFAGILPVPLYTVAEDAANDSYAAPLQLQLLYNDNDVRLFYSLGRGNAYDRTEEILKFNTWYTVQVEVNLAKADHASGVKLSVGPRGGELTEVDLSAGTNQYNIPAWVQGRTMNRISTGLDAAAYTDMFLDNIQATTVNGYSANLSVDKNDIDVNDTFAIQVEVDHDNLPQYSAGEFKVAYDADKVRLDSVTNAVTGEEDIGIRYSAANGVVTVEDFGNDHDLAATYILNFTAIAEGEAAFELQSAAFIDKANASKSDLLPILNDPDVVTFTIDPAPHTVTIDDENDYIINDAASVRHGADYTFNVVEYDKYDYTITVNGEEDVAIPGENGLYTIPDVAGDLAISVTRTPKVFNVTIEGTTAANDGATATYGEDYHFTLPANVAPGVNAGTNYTATVTIGGATASLTIEGQSYTIRGADIIGDIVITVTATPVAATQFSVTVDGNGAGEAAGFAATGTRNQDYTLTLTPVPGYNYTVSATVDGTPVDATPAGNTYTVAAFDGAVLAFTVERTVITTDVTVQQYITLQNTKMWLVLQEQDLGGANYATYNGEAMFYSAHYNAYAYLVIAENLSLEDAKAQIGVGSGARTEIDYSNDVNLTGKIDASDAQYTYNMYNTYYNAFSGDETMYEFLLADINNNKQVDVRDAVAIINGLLNLTPNP